MKKKLLFKKLSVTLCILSLFGFFSIESSYAQLAIKSTVTSTFGAEISAFDPATNRLFTVAGNAIEYYTVSNTGVLSSPTEIPFGFTIALGTTALPNSVAVKNGVLAFGFAIVGANNAQQQGKVAFYNPATATYISDVTVGYLPDMIAFSPDGTKILTANEGEPNSYNQATSFDPEGSVSIIDISAGIAGATVTEATFTSFNSQMATLKAAGVRIYGPNATVAQDLEPEYITFIDNATAAVTLQENNAVAIINIATATITNIYPLGLKDHNIAGNGFDASDRDLTSSTGRINIQNWPVKGMYMPDTIASFTSGGNTYFITANEGDSRDYTGFTEEIRVGAAGYTLDATVFPNASTLKLNANLGRLQLSNATGNTDADAAFEEIHALGSRSFSIWNSTFTQVFDSGDQLEQISATQNPTAFNSDGTSSSFDSRSDNKGPEPEGVVTGMVNGVLYAFVGSERTGDIFMYDITNPTAPVFKQYINTAADLGVEGLLFVSASESPTGNALVIVSAEVSKTVSVYEFTPPSVNLSVSTNTASETTGTVVTVTATASEPVFGDKTVSVAVSGTNITATDFTLSNTTITIPSGSTTGSVTFTTLSDNLVETLETATITISNPSAGIALGTTTTQNIAISDFVFKLQILHASDFEGAVEAVADAPRFAAIVDQLEETHANTIKLSSGDNYIPGPFLSSGGDPSLAAAYKTAYESYYNTTFTSPPVNLGVSIGRADISIMNFIGIEASALGNHEFDLGTNEIRTMIGGANSGANTTWFGAQFPYLSANLNFSGDGNLSPIATTNRLLPNTAFQSNPTETVSAITSKLKLAPSTIIIKGGQKIGIVGATTQVLASISSPGATTVVGGNANDMNILAGIVQPVVNSLIADGCNKIILLSHLQQIAFEKDLATKLTGVDIIIAAGSNTLMADANDRLRTGDVAAENYPFLATDLSGKTIPVVNTDGNYKYVGRLVVDFDSDGNLIPSSIDPVISGVYAADAQGLNDAWGANVANAFAPGTKGYQVQLLCNAINNVIISKDGNLFGKTSVFLEGRRNFVRTEETNLGNVSAEANLWLAKFYDPTTVISIKNGGGIRSAIGNVLAVGDNVTLAPPIANPAAGKQSGDISQLDIENSLRFNNQLSIVTLTASGMRAILERAVSGTTATATPGQFAQVAGVRYSYDFTLPVNSRIQNAVITDANGNVIDTLVVNGTTVGDLSRTFRVVTLNFLASGGDGYPFNTLSTNRIDLNTLPELGPAAASFTNPGSEQDAFAEYMKNQFSTTPYGIADTPLVQDCRIQRVPARTDNVLPPNAGTNGTLVICNATTVTEAQLFAALDGTPQAGGVWSPTLAGAGTYTYTVTSPSCSGSAAATVTVTEFATPTPTTTTITSATPYTWSLSGLTYNTTGVYTFNTLDGNGCTVVNTLNLTITVNSFNLGTSCGGTVSSLAVTVVATPVAGASTYTFRITNLTTSASFVVNRPVNSFALSNYSGITLGTAYQVEVSVNGGANYGTPCIVNTPAPTSTIGAQCGTTLTSMGQFVYATFVSSVTRYRFRVTNLTTNAVQVYDAPSGQNRFTFNQLSAAIRAFGTTYSVEVALRNTDGTYLPFNAACNITTPAFPTSEVILSQCDTVATSNTQTISAVAVSGATSYRFELVNASVAYTSSIDRPINNFNLAMFAGLQSGTTYVVRVAVRIGGVWGSLTGKPCNITTPGIAVGGTREIAVNNNFAAIAYPNPFADNFMLNVTSVSESTIQIRVYDMLGKQVENRNVEASDLENLQIGSAYPSGVYNVLITQGENNKTLRVIKR